MLDSHERKRYARHLLLDSFGERAQLKLKQSSVLIVGLGGLGSPVALYLAAAGVGKLFVADGDNLEESNLQRQILYRSTDAGRSKAELAKEELSALNPTVEVEPVEEFLNAESLDYYVAEVGLVIDCTDNLSARSLINAACVAHSCALITAAAIRWEGQIALFDYRTSTSPCFNCMSPVGTPEPAENCSNAGVIGPVLGIVGSYQALMAIQLLTEQPIKTNVLHLFDGKRGNWMDVDITPNPACRVCARP